MTSLQTDQATNVANTVRAPVIEFRDVTFGYGAAPVIEDVTFSLDEHDLVSVLGPNGGGKTTLLKLLLGLIRPDAGTVRVFGGSAAAARPRVGYMPQYIHYDPQFPVSVLDIVLMGRLGHRWGGGYSRTDKSAARAALDEMEVADLSRSLFAELSGGQRQRVLIARALACEPDLLLLDEPTANIDPRVEAQLYKSLRQLSRRMTILLVTHDLGVVSNIVQKVICVNRRVVMHPTSEITGDAIQDIYGGDIRMVRHDHHHELGGFHD